MAVRAHLKELNNKHAMIDKKIEKMLKQPIPDTIALTRLKKQKLQIKEKITQLQAD